MTDGPLATPALAPTVGLKEQEALRRLVRDGANELPVSRPRSMLRLVREVAFEPMFLLLVACGALYMVLGDVQEALMLLGFVFVVMGISFFQQRRSERSLDALRDLSSPQARVIRGAKERTVAARDLVVGDIVMLAEGDRVPADLSLIVCANLAVDESLLTGESAPVLKQAGPLAGSVLASWLRAARRKVGSLPRAWAARWAASASHSRESRPSPPRSSRKREEWSRVSPWSDWRLRPRWSFLSGCCVATGYKRCSPA